MAAYDAIVIGAGGMGCAALFHLARRGAKVLGLEQYDVPHDLGSSHGQSRAIRRAYFEHAAYVPLINRAYDLWAELENSSNTRLFERCGVLMAGWPDGQVISGIRETAKQHDIGLEELDAPSVVERFAGLIPNGTMVAVFEKDAGFLHVEACTKAHAEAAVAAGATLKINTPVQSLSKDGNHWQVVTSGGETFVAEKVVVCGGAWTSKLLPELKLPLKIKRKLLLWYQPAEECYRLEAGFPVFAFDTFDGEFFYGFPAMDERGIKLARHSGGLFIDDVDEIDRDLHPDDEIHVARFLSTHLPGVTAKLNHHAVCCYTMTPDDHFLIDHHPDDESLMFATGFSGHGYKFAPVIGEVLADLALTGATDQPIAFLRQGRFVQAG